jgi:hypothetical protein
LEPVGSAFASFIKPAATPRIIYRFCRLCNQPAGLTLPKKGYNRTSLARKETH